MRKTVRVVTMSVLGLALTAMLVAPASAAGRQIRTDGDDSRSLLDLNRVVFRYTGGNIIGKMSTHEAWRIRDIASVTRAGDRNFYMIFDTSGDFRMDYYVGVYRKSRHLVAIVREKTAAGQIGKKVAQVPAQRDGRRVEFKFSGSLVGVQGSRIHWAAYTLDSRTCDRRCMDQVPNNDRWSVYRF